MRTTIVALLAFLVFFSLSCQKDSGVESAGNKIQKDNAKLKNKTYQNGDHASDYRYHAHVRIYQDNQEGEEEQKIVDTVFESNAMQYYGNSSPITFPTLPGSAKTIFHVSFEFSWQDCCNCNLYTSAVPVECEFVISQNVEEDKVNPGWHDLMRTTLIKSYGIASGTESVDYPILHSYPLKLDPNMPVNVYGISVSWVQHPYLYNHDYPCTSCYP